MIRARTIANQKIYLDPRPTKNTMTFKGGKNKCKKRK